MLHSLVVLFITLRHFVGGGGGGGGPLRNMYSQRGHDMDKLDM